MDFNRTFHAAALAAFGLAAGACQQSRSPLELVQVAATVEAEADAAPQDARASEAQAPGAGLLAYIGEIFAEQQRVLAGKSPEAEVPGF